MEMTLRMMRVQDLMMGRMRSSPTLDAARRTGEIYRMFSQEIAPLTAVMAERVGDLIDDYGAEAVEYAIGEAAALNKRSLSYVRAVARACGATDDHGWGTDEGGSNER